MPRSTPRAPVSPLTWVRRLFLPAVALGVALTLFDERFDLEEVRADLAAGRVDAALAALQRAPRDRLIPELAAVSNWQPARARRLVLDLLRQRAAAGELFESAAHPTIVAPLGRHRDPPREFLLREPAERALGLQVVHRDLQLPVADVPVEPGQRRVDPGVGLIAGSHYVATLYDGHVGDAVALVAFEVLPARQAHDVGLVLAAARDLAPTEASGELLVAVAAMHFGLHQEAEQRLRRAAADPDLAPAARELRALALDELGLDLSALALLDDDPAQG